MKITHRIPWAIPYGYTEVEYDPADSPTEVDLDQIMDEVRAMEAAYSGVTRLPAPPEYHDDPGPQEPPAPARVVVDETGAARVAGTGERVTGEVFYCPTCRQQAKPSVERYQEWETGADGREYAQKWFCPNNACATKSIWRSKLVSR